MDRRGKVALAGLTVAAAALSIRLENSYRFGVALAVFVLVATRPAARGDGFTSSLATATRVMVVALLAAGTVVFAAERGWL